MSVSPFEHPWLSGLFGDREIAACFDAEADIEAMLEFERALAQSGAALGFVSRDAATAIAAAVDDEALDRSALKVGFSRDGVVVPELVRQLRRAIGEEHGGSLHLGATSQDVVDTSLSLRLVRVIDIIVERLVLLDGALGALGARDGDIRVMGHTRMQAAIPVPAMRKIESWLLPLVRHAERMRALKPEICVLHLGGAAGTLDSYGEQAAAMRRDMAARLGLYVSDTVRHSERDSLVLFTSLLAGICGSLGKLGQDVALAAQSEMGEIRLREGGGSSAMPHKVNPVAAETLVTIARFAATLSAGMHHALVHENERSGSAWALEWMVLPQIAAATGAALLVAPRLVHAIAFVPRTSA